MKKKSISTRHQHPKRCQNGFQFTGWMNNWSCCAELSFIKTLPPVSRFHIVALLNLTLVKIGPLYSCFVCGEVLLLLLVEMPWWRGATLGCYSEVTVVMLLLGVPQVQELSSESNAGEPEAVASVQFYSLQIKTASPRMECFQLAAMFVFAVTHWVLPCDFF